MGDVNLEIKLSNLDERVIKIEESGGGSGGDGYITSVSNDFDVVNKKLLLSNDITTKLSRVGEQILGTVSGNTATFTDAKIGGSDVYLTDIYCSDSARYIKSQSVSGNVLTVTFDDSVASATCVAQLYKKGV